MRSTSAASKADIRGEWVADAGCMKEEDAIRGIVDRSLGSSE